jgi:hypothetical protein
MAALQSCWNIPFDRDKVNFRDDLFDSPAGDWVESFSDAHFRQRYLHEKSLIYCETLMTVHGTTDIEPAVALIRGPWDWWEHGRITGFAVNDDGSTDQTLSPVWWFITRVGLHISPPIDLPELHGQRVPLLLTEHFTGPATMDVYPDGSGDALIIRGRFHGVEYHVPGVPNKVAEWLHLDAESGTMPAPFPKGTGWVCLLHKLESHSAAKRIEISQRPDSGGIVAEVSPRDNR